MDLAGRQTIVLVSWIGGSWQATVKLVVALIVTYSLVLWVAAIAWTYGDVRSRTRDAFVQALAVIGVLVFNVAGLLVYFILRPRVTLAEVYARELEEEALLQELEAQHVCPSCRRRVEPDFIVCPTCQARLRESCTSCARALLPNWTACPYCGTPRRPALVTTRPTASGAAPAAATTPSPAFPARPSARAARRPGAPASEPTTARETPTASSASTPGFGQ